MVDISSSMELQKERMVNTMKIKKIQIILIITIFSLSFFASNTYGDSSGTVEISLRYTNGDRISSNFVEIKIFQENSNEAIQIINERNSESTYITELKIFEKYRMDIFINGIFSGSKNFELKNKYEYLDVSIPLSNGLSFNVLYNDNSTPISGLTVSIFSNEGKFVTKGTTNKEGDTIRFWIPPTTLYDDYYNAKFTINENIIYEYFNIELPPGGKTDLKIITPWPTESLLELTIYEDKISRPISDNTELFVELKNDSYSFNTKVNHGVALIPKLPIGNYQMLVINSNTFNPELRILSNQTITISEKSHKENIILKKPISVENISDENHHIDSSKYSSIYFQEGHKWIQESAKGKQTDDKNNYVIGSQSLSLITEGDSSPVFTRSPKMSPTLNLENKTVNAWFKIDDPSSVKELWFTLSSDNFNNGWLTYNYSPNIKKINSNEWTYVSLPTKNFKQTGEQDLSSINRIQIRVTDTGTANVTLNLNEISFSKTNTTSNNSMKNNFLEESSCDCVAFRLDDVQDYWLNDVQLKIMNVFDEEEIPLTVGVIGKFFGNDQKILNHIKKHSINSKLDVANHGWEHEDFTNYDFTTQKEIIKKTNDVINKLLYQKPVVFITPFNNFNDDTLKALKENKIVFLSSDLDKSKPSYPLNKQSFYEFPQTAFMGDLTFDRTKFIGFNSTVSFHQVKSSIDNYGFAVITLHPQEFSTFKNDKYNNEINSQQLYELKNLIHKIKDSNLKTVLIKEIPTNVIIKPQIPEWIRNNAGWWANGDINDKSFILGIQFLINEKIIKISNDKKNIEINKTELPLWIKNNAKWWSNGQINDKTFIQSIQYLINNKIILLN